MAAGTVRRFRVIHTSPEQCDLGWQESLVQLLQLVEPGIPG